MSLALAPPRDGMHALGRILMAEQDLIVIALIFPGDWRRSVSYFLVYDDIDASLSVISCYLPDPHQANLSSKPFPRRAVGGACELLLMACQVPPGSLLAPPNNPPAGLCVFSPARSEANSAACPWQIKGRSFPLAPGELRQPFIGDAAFSLQGKAFWADPTQGLVCCDLHTTTATSSDRGFGFIELPRECQLDLAQTLKVRDEGASLTRAMGCVGGSVCFVCIHRSSKKYADDVLTTWTLELPAARWKKEGEVSAKELWEFDGFREAGLPEAPPEFPVLTADGALFVVLTEQRRQSLADGVLVGHICSIDVLNKKLLWHGLVHDYPFIEPVVFPSTFQFLPRKKHGQHTEEVQWSGSCSITGSLTMDQLRVTEHDEDASSTSVAGSRPIGYLVAH